VEVGFARQQTDRLLGFRERRIGALVGERLAAFVVGVVGGLCAYGLREGRAIAFDPGIAARRQAIRCIDCLCGFG
jgi:hypothetical protein